jgi:hypothetical protein
MSVWKGNLKKGREGVKKWFLKSEVAIRQGQAPFSLFGLTSSNTCDNWLQK